MMIFLLIIGFICVIKGADFLVDGASSLAKKFRVSDLVIGLTIVAFGTSAPELIVNIFASIRGTTDIAIGNILGSNIANIFLILGISAIIYPLVVSKTTIWKEIPLSLMAVVVIGLMANDKLIDNQNFAMISRIDGFILLCFFAIFLYYTFEMARSSRECLEIELVKHSLPKIIILISGGLVLLVVGGEWIVRSATSISRDFGLSESLIGLTVVAIGTSLPELATSAVAAYKKKVDIAVGNIVGSNIFNIFWILGVSSIINPLVFQERSNIDIFVAGLASLLLFIFMFLGKSKNVLERWQGITFVLIYIAYIAFLVLQEMGI